MTALASVLLVWYAGEAPDSKQRRLNLIKAVEGDDWSGVIDSQTQQTLEGMSCQNSELDLLL